MAPLTGEITRLIAAIQKGDPDAQGHLMALVYKDLHAQARRYMRRERADHTLQPTALVHEAYLRMMGDSYKNWNGRAHFFAASAVVMRRILVDYARKRASAKSPQGKQQVELNDVLSAEHPRMDQILILDELLTQLAAFDARKARVVELMFFGDLKEEEVAELLGVSGRTVKRDWQAARAWLEAKLRRKRGPEDR